MDIGGEARVVDGIRFHAEKLNEHFIEAHKLGLSVIVISRPYQHPQQVRVQVQRELLDVPRTQKTIDMGSE